MDKAIGIDIGGSGIKAAVVDLTAGKLVTERRRLVTPQPPQPKAVCATIAKLLAEPEYDKTLPIGAGFPGVIKHGVILTAANLGRRGVGLDGRAAIGEAIGAPVSLVNDADAAGLAEVKFGAGKDKKGITLIVTLGTGIGCGLFVDGVLVPNTELGHIEMDGKDAEDRAAASVRELKKLAWKVWAKRVQAYLNAVDKLVWPDLIIIGGGVSATPEKFFSFGRSIHEVSLSIATGALFVPNVTVQLELKSIGGGIVPENFKCGGPR